MKKSTLMLFAVTLAALAGGSLGWPQWMRTQGHGQIQSLKAGSWGDLITSRSADMDMVKEELRFMAEFSKFMNHRVPHLLQEFANRKRIYSTKHMVMKAQSMMDKERKSRPTRDVSGRQEEEKNHAHDEEGNPLDAEEEEEHEHVDVVGAVADVADTVVDVVEDAVDNVEEVADAVVDATVDVIDAVDTSGTVGDAVEGATDAAEEIGDAAGELATDIIDVLTTSGTDVVDLFQDIVSSVGAVLEDTVPPSAWNYVCLATWWPLHEEHCTTARCAACGPAVTSAMEVCKRSFGEEGLTHKCAQTVMGEGFCNYCIDDYLL